MTTSDMLNVFLGVILVCVVFTLTFGAVSMCMLIITMVVDDWRRRRRDIARASGRQT